MAKADSCYLVQTLKPRIIIPIKEHIMLKNPVFDGRVFVTPVLSQMLSPDHLHVVNNILNLDVNFLQDS